ncbi:MAG: vWA domain-containing protein [Chloroflexota bacterium]
MSFFNLIGIWSAIIIPVIIIMYLLKRRRQDRPVSSILLWEQVLRDAAANVPWQRLRRNLLLLLQLLVALALVLAIMRPFVSGATAGGDLFLIVDTSASMQAVDVAPSRMAAAIERAQAIVAGLGPRDAVTLIELGQRPRVILAASRNRGQIKAALQGLRATNGPAALEPALNLAVSLAAGKQAPALVVISDGGVIAPTAGFTVPYPVRFERVGGPATNLAVAAVSSRVIGGRTVGLARVVNYSLADADYALELAVDGRPFDVRRGSLKPGESRELLWELPQGTRTISASLTGADALAADNAAFAVTGERGEAKVLLVSSGNVFLERALALSPGITVTNLQPDAADLVPPGYDLYVYDGALPDALPNAPLLVLNPPSGSLGAGAELAPGELTPPRRGEPLLEFVGTTDVAIAKTRSLTVPTWGRTVLESSATTLIYAGERSGQRAVVIGFDLHQTNLPLRPAFPILVQNIAGWLLPGRETGLSAAAPGEPVAVRPSPQAESVTVVSPSGASTRIAPPFPAEPYTATGEIGLYTVRERVPGGDRTSYFAVNPVELESAITGADSLPLAVAGTGAADVQTTGNRELWPLLAWLALFILAAEWWVYNRGL